MSRALPDWVKIAGHDIEVVVVPSISSASVVQPWADRILISEALTPSQRLRALRLAEHCYPSPNPPRPWSIPLAPLTSQ